MDNMCLLCGKYKDNMEHILFLCNAKATLFDIDLGIRWSKENVKKFCWFNLIMYRDQEEYGVITKKELF